MVNGEARLVMVEFRERVSKVSHGQAEQRPCAVPESVLGFSMSCSSL